MQHRVLSLALALLTVSLPLSAAESVSIDVAPRHGFTPVNLRVRVRVEPSRDNRTLEVVADSVDFYRRSVIQLDGEHAPRTIVLEFRDIPPGEYEVSGIVLNAAGARRGGASQQVSILSTRSER